MKYIYLFSKYGKWIGVLGFVGTLFSDNEIFLYLSIMGILIFVEILINCSILFNSLYQLIAMIKISIKYKDKKTLPSIENFKSSVEYSLPFKGKWAVVNGCYTEDFSHSWSIHPQRYAYDFIILDEQAKSYDGKFNECSSYYCYDKEILAPADGVVVKVINKFDDSQILKNGKFYSKAKHIAGNYIVIKHNENEYSTLAHLRKGSIRVLEGDTIKKGQVIAQCGNTGNSTEPHLHFQLQNSKSFFCSIGLPICFHNIKPSKIDNYEKFDNRICMSFEEIIEGYLTRGINVENMIE